MRKFILFLLCVAGAAGAQAKDNNETRTINGAVIDQTGNPLPGAIIETKDGLTTTADADGSFTLEVPKKTKWLRTSYPGIGLRLIKLKNRDEATGYSLIELKKKRSGYFFYSFQFGAAFSNGSYSFGGDDVYEGQTYLSFGASFGYLNNWGGYFTATGNEESGAMLSVGATKRLWTSWTYRSSLYVYFGAGYDGMQYGGPDDETDFASGVLAEAGLIYRHRHFVAKIGYGHTFGTTYSGTSAEHVNAAIGFCF